MKKVLKRTGIVLIGLFVIALIFIAVFYFKAVNNSKKNMSLLGDEAPIINQNGLTYRDLNKNGKIDIYEDYNASLKQRVDNLVAQMTIEEKAGALFVAMIGTSPDGKPVETPIITGGMRDLMMSLMLPSNSEMIAKKKMNSFNILSAIDAKLLANYNNIIQKMAERTRLGIPITIASDPRHGTENNPGAAIYTPTFSQWPSSLGLAATRDTILVREFGDIARQEYLAVGIRLALHPMADLATEPRWGRVNGTFGEDAELSAMLTKAYVLGFQGDSLSKQSVACMTKHFSGGGPQKDGEDAHFPYGKEQVYPGENFDYHLIPFIKGAFKAHTAQIMPYYGIPMDQTDENVAFGFNKVIITKLLRDSLNFQGVVCTDWNLITDSKIGEGRAWGVENLTPKQRVKKVLDAGCDQFGGESIPELIVALVKEGELSEERIDISVKRVMRDKFRLGLFDNPYVDEQKATEIAGRKPFREKGRIAQQKSVVLLKNNKILPLKKGIKVFLDGFTNSKALDGYATLVYKAKEADVIISRIRTPYEKRDQFFLEQFFHQGRLFFTKNEEKEIIDLISQKPSIVVVNLERPAILTAIAKQSNALLGEFGATDKVLFSLLFGEVKPSGKLPFELPSSQEAVEEQLEDLPYDSKDPLFPYGYGLTYK